MKKIIALLLVLIMACGCSNTGEEGNAKISQEKEEVYFKYDGKSYTNNDAYQRLKAQNVDTYFEYLVANKACEIDNISLDEDKAELEEEYDSMAEAYGEELVQAYYGDKESFINNYILSYAYMRYGENYIKENIDKYIEEHPTLYVEYISSTSKSKMNTFLKQVKKGSDFEKASEKAKFEENETVTKEVIETSTSYLPEAVIEKLSSMESGDYSDLIEIESEDEETASTYYIVRLVSNDAKTDYEDEFVEYLMNSGEIQSITMIVKEKHDLKMYDDDFNNTYQNIIKTYSESESAE